MPEFQALSDQARDLKSHTLEYLDVYLEEFESKVQASGGHVHWAETSAQACQEVLSLCQTYGVRKVTKGKSMVTEEIGLNPYLHSHGIETIETDLGEYIIQLRQETPSHIIVPALHLNQAEIAQTFRARHTHLDPDRSLMDPAHLVQEARLIMRQRFQESDLGITGANFLIAQSGTTVIVTNEGNGDLTQLLPRVHVVIAGLEKVVPTFQDTFTLLRLLARSATGQDFSAYTTFSTGPRRSQDQDGPHHFHVILVDNGRTQLLRTPFQEVLHCIRCGACMNHCPVYEAVGGHSYGWVYPGPIGSALNPGLLGIKQAHPLPNASSFCGRCEEVCPVQIPLTKLMRGWRQQEYHQNLHPVQRIGLGVFAPTGAVSLVVSTVYSDRNGFSARMGTQARTYRLYSLQSLDRQPRLAGPGGQAVSSLNDLRLGKMSATTPMMEQYFAIRQEHQDCILFYRMGDFYEMFFDDAIVASKALNITLTKRGQHKGKEIPMCGVPVHNYEGYLRQLVTQGFRVGLCEQTKEITYNGLVDRQVVRIFTQGTLLEDSLLESNAHHFLLCIAQDKERLGAAWSDVSTGEFFTQPVSQAGLKTLMIRLNCREILIPQALRSQEALGGLWREWDSALTIQEDSLFDSVTAFSRIKHFYEVSFLDGFGTFTTPEITAAGTLIGYLERTQKGNHPYLSPPKRITPGTILEIDPATRRNLELSSDRTQSPKHSLLGVIDQTQTSAGARLLASYLASPITDISSINHRLDAIEFWIGHPEEAQTLHRTLSECLDIERALSRLVLGHGGPRDLGTLRDSLSCAARIKTLLTSLETDLPQGLAECHASIDPDRALLTELKQTLIPTTLPISVREGNFIAPQACPALAEQIHLRDQGRQLIAALQARYVKEYKIASLKIKYNTLLGYYIEIPSSHRERLLDQEELIYRQATANTVRFRSQTLIDLETKITQATERVATIEQELFDLLLEKVKQQAATITATAKALAVIDVSLGLHRVASTQGWCRPLLDESFGFEIQGGRHPIVEIALKQDHAVGFIANDCRLTEESRLWLLTGPNMAGKSTFLRQNALIAILAQMGSYVPASFARIGRIDRIFSRIGAADDLARGQSTFMVEMIETSIILHQATRSSLVILDEIGRGTSTLDGLSIASACIEYLHDQIGCRCLFATHYHELTQLDKKLPHLHCYTMRTREWKGDIVFLYQLIQGVADDSYGIHVARLAGLPKKVITRAYKTFKSLEKVANYHDHFSRTLAALPLFASTAPLEPDPLEPDPLEPSPLEPSPLEQELDLISPDTLTPKQALDLLYRLKALITKSTAETEATPHDSDSRKEEY